MVHKNTEGQLDMNILRETAEKCKNWGKWGPDDEAGTLNYIGPEEIIAAAGLIKKGKTFSLGLNFDNQGPQSGLWGNRFNPIHTMLATGTDALAGNQDEGGIRYADDMVSLPLQCGTQWDALGHIFYDDKMWNGYDAALVDSTGAKKNGIEKVKDRMVGRGVLLDIAKHIGVESLADQPAVVIGEGHHDRVDRVRFHRGPQFFWCHRVLPTESRHDGMRRIRDDPARRSVSSAGSRRIADR